MFRMFVHFNLLDYFNVVSIFVFTILESLLCIKSVSVWSYSGPYFGTLLGLFIIRIERL